MNRAYQFCDVSRIEGESVFCLVDPAGGYWYMSEDTFYQWRRMFEVVGYPPEGARKTKPLSTMTFDEFLAESSKLIEEATKRRE